MTITFSQTNVGNVPAQTSGLASWFDATDTSGDGSVISDATAIASWVDKSGVGSTVAQATADSQPTVKIAIIAGKSVVRFDGTDDDMALASVAATADMSIFIAQNVLGANATASSCVCMNGSNDFQIQSANFSDKYYSKVNTVNLGETSEIRSSVNLIGAPFITTVIFSNGDSDVTLRIDGSEVGTDTYNGAMSTTQELILGANRGKNQWLQTDIAEIVFINKDVSTAETLAMERYLGNKWGISV